MSDAHDNWIEPNYDLVQTVQRDSKAAPKGASDVHLGGHLVMVCQIYHQLLGSNPSLVEFRYARPLQSDEQVYERSLKIGKSWQKIDSGWLDRVSLLVISNKEGEQQFTQPTREEVSQLATKTIEIGVQWPNEASPTSLFIVRPGMVFQVEPNNLGVLYLRSERGPTKCSITLFPV